MLQAFGRNAIGLSSADGNVIPPESARQKDIDYGYGRRKEGEYSKHSWYHLLEAGMTPVFCAITHDSRAVAQHQCRHHRRRGWPSPWYGQYQASLYYCFEKPGVMTDIDDGFCNPVSGPGVVCCLSGAGIIAEGMIPKLDNAFRALKAGVASVHIGDRKSLALGELRSWCGRLNSRNR